SPARSRHRPRPPSFPTRRSSDLEKLFQLGHVRAAFEINPQLLVLLFGENVAPVKRVAMFAGHIPAPPAIGERRAKINQFRTTLQDRKSTRLNSSHVKISYAVLCL